MEGDSDRSGGTYVLSDSGGLIDLSAVESDSPASKKGNSSLDKSQCSSGSTEGDGKKRCRHPSDGGWLADMEGKMKDMKWIEDEEFDFDIPEEYLNISLEDPSSPSFNEESFEEQNLVKQDAGQDQPLVQTDQSVHPSFVDDCPAVGPLLDIERRTSSADSGVDSADSPQEEKGISQLNFKEKGTLPLGGNFEKGISPHRIVFDTTRGCVVRRAHRSSIDLGILRKHNLATKYAEDGTSCNLLDVQSGSEAELFPSKGNLGVRKSSSASRLLAPNLRNCSTFSTPVISSPQEELRTTSKENLTNIHAPLTSETFIVDRQRPSSDTVNAGDTFRIDCESVTAGSTCKVEQPCDSVATDKSSTFRIEQSGDSVPAGDSSTASNETFTMSGGGSTTASRENLDDSSSSATSQGSTGGSRIRPTARGIPKRTKLSKPASKPALLPLKTTGAATTIPKCLRKPTCMEKPGTAKPSMLSRPQKLKAQPKDIPTKQNTGADPKISGRTKPLKALGRLKAPAINGAGKSMVQRRDSKSSVTAIKEVLPSHPQNVTARQSKEARSTCQNVIPLTATPVNPPQPIALLSTSMVSNSSPSVKQSTPIKSAVKETPKRSSVVTPKNLVGSTPKIQQFSLSSIEGGSTPSIKQRCPRTNETYVVPGTPAGGGSDPAIGSTPKSDKKKRRSFIPTPGGQDRVSKFTSPIPFNPNLSMDTEPGNTDTSPVAKVAPKRAMPPPKTRRALNPRGLQRPQRGRGAVLGVRNGKSMVRRDGPVKAQKFVGYGGYDFESEVPIPRARVVHSPIDKENRPATPHSEWSPIRRKRRPLTADEECTQCTKYNAM